jgi:hypothetical protein
MILPALSLIYPSLFPHSPLSLSARAVSHAIVSDFGCTARLVCHRAQPPPMFPFMPHSLSPYALYPDDSCVIVTHPLCSLYAIGPLLFPIVTVTSPLISVYISEVHSLYSLVLISQDFLFSCLNLCELAVGNPSSYLPCPLYSFPDSLTVRTWSKVFDRTSASPLDSTVP